MRTVGALNPAAEARIDRVRAQERPSAMAHADVRICDDNSQRHGLFDT
jgi:hypothetical protein